MPTITRYRATFQDGTVLKSIWTERTLTHSWRWTGEDGNGRHIGGSGFAGSETLARKQIKSGTSRLTKRPRRSKYEIDEDWKPGGFVTSEEIVLAEAVEVKAVNNPPHYLVRSVSPCELLQSWIIDAELRTTLQRYTAAASIADIWEGLTEKEQRILVKLASEKDALDVTELLNSHLSK